MRPLRSSQSPAFSSGLNNSLNAVAVLLAVGFLLVNLLFSILQAFSEDFLLGLRSLAAGGVPLLITFYFGYLARLQVPTRDSKAPVINNFVIFALWTVLMIGLDGTYNYVRFPFSELLYSFTLSVMIWRYKRRNSVSSLIAASYGVILGWLTAFVIFGWESVT